MEPTAIAAAFVLQCAHAQTPPVAMCNPRGKPLCLHAQDHASSVHTRTLLDHAALVGLEHANDADADLREPDRIITRSNRAAGGITIQFFVFGDVTPDAASALQLAAEYCASVIENPIEVNLYVHLSPFGLGGSFPTLVEVPYPLFRGALQRGADANDVLQDYLPEESFPARHQFDGPISQEDTVVLSSANAKSLRLIGNNGSIDGKLYIGSVPDGNPEDGIGNGAGTGYYAQFSLVDIVVHEITHMLGFFNAYDVGMSDPTTLDLFRFARTGPENPGTLEDFTTTPRALYLGDYEAERKHNFDFINREHRAENGSAGQPSHFEETGAYPFRVGVMEPAFAPFETGYPNYFSQADLDALDAIGYAITTPAPPIPCNVADIAEPIGIIDLEDIALFVSAFNTGLPEADLADPTQLHDLNDVVAFVNAFQVGCQ